MLLTKNWKLEMRREENIKGLLLALLMSISFSSNAHAITDVCKDFIPLEQINRVAHLEKNGICYIDDKTDISLLTYDKSDTLKKIEQLIPKSKIIELSVGLSKAKLVNGDLLYALEKGNEQAGVCIQSHMEQQCTYKNVCKLVCVAAAAELGRRTGAATGAATLGQSCQQVCENIPECINVSVCDVRQPY